MTKCRDLTLMRGGKSLILVMMILLSFTIINSLPAHAQFGFGLSFDIFNWKSASRVTPACLPIRDRMSRDRMSACHCPPQSKCPKDANEWRTSPKIPTGIAMHCCDLPSECSETRRQTAASCGGSGGFSQALIDTCLKYQPKLSVNDLPPVPAKKCKYIINSEYDKYRHEYPESCCTARENEKEDMRIEEVKQMRAKIQEYDAINTRINSCLAKCNSNSLFAANSCAQTCINQTAGVDGKSETPYLTCVKPLRGVACTVTVPRRCSRGGMFSDCFISGTKITLADGSQKDIEGLKVGDMVKGVEGSNTVLAVALNMTSSKQLYSINDGQLVLTEGHPLKVADGWVAIEPLKVAAGDEFKRQIRKLKTGDKLIGKDKRSISVYKIEPIVEEEVPIDRYNLSVSGDKTFFANGFLTRGYKNTLAY